jgi:biopolymer transport protein ExbD
MRRFSQRSALVTLSEINITPLLDLAFVLLIIFVITTPLLEQGLPLSLHKGGLPDTAKPDPRNIRTVDILPQGTYRLQKQPMSLPAILTELERDHRANDQLIVFIRPDENGRNKELMSLIDGCQKRGITKYSLRTEPEKGGR